jgi:chloramphenicol 3-O phosphotransferase
VEVAVPSGDGLFGAYNFCMQTASTLPSGKIIIINGPSSSGKSTLALALQQKLDTPFIRFSFDLFLDHKSLPIEQIRNQQFSWELMRPAVFTGLHQCLPALASAGNNVVFDHIIETKDWLHNLISCVADFDVFFVGLHCSLPELERREMLRGNRRHGEALADFQTVHTITAYDLELNSEHPLDENTNVLIKSWKERQRPSALDKMLAAMNKI